MLEVVPHMQEAIPIISSYDMTLYTLLYLEVGLSFAYDLVLNVNTSGKDSSKGLS